MKASAWERPCTPAPTISKGPCGAGANSRAASSETAAVRRAGTGGPAGGGGGGGGAGGGGGGGGGAADPQPALAGGAVEHQHIALYRRAPGAGVAGGQGDELDHRHAVVGG